MSLASGTRIGPYTVSALIGAGGMGEVYRGIDTNLKRAVAIKVLPAAVAGDAERLVRFQREAELLAVLNHVNIAAVYGLERNSDITALVMELVEGPTLAERIAEGPLPLDEAIRVARQIADALSAAHDQGIVHRDLKPANIKVRADGTVKVLDFGLAKAVAPGSTTNASTTMSPTISMAATVAGFILGTAAYMSPEQASGRPVDKRADIWAFGVILWEMLTGRQMFKGETISHVLAAVLTKEPDLSVVPLRVRPLLARCLDKDPRTRLRDIGDAMSLIEPPAGAATTPERRRWMGIAGWVVAGIVAVMALAVSWWTATPAVPGAVLPPVRFEIERTSLDPYNNAITAFALSPDGRFLAHYGADARGEATLFVRTLVTGESLEVAGSQVLSPLAPFWSADSRYVVFTTGVDARVFDTATATAQPLCDCRFRGGSWNREGVILLGATPANREPIRRLSMADRTPVAVTTVDQALGEQDVAPVFLPDGRRFLFTRSTPESEPDTYVGSLDGDAPRQIADGSRHLIVPAFNGRGAQLLGINAGGLIAQPFDLDAATIGEGFRIVVAGAAAASVSENGVLATTAAGGRPLMVPTWYDREGMARGSIGGSGALESVALARDGGRLAVSQVRGSEAANDIWVRDVARGTDTRLTFGNSDDNDVSPVWSSDGTRILVSGRREGVVNLFLRASDGTGGESRLFPADQNVFANDWSRDGRWVIYTMPKRERPTDLDLWVVPMNGGVAGTPMPYVTSSAREVQAEFSPDGRFVVYTSDESGTAEIYVQPFPNATDGKWMISSGGGVEPRWSPDGRELFYFAGQTLMTVPVSLRPSFSSRTPMRLFNAPIQPGYTNDSDRWQVAPDGRRFVLLVPAGPNQVPPIDVVVNWPALLAR